MAIGVRAGGEQDVSKDDKEIVSAVRARLAERVGRDRYELWFGPSTELQLGDGTLTIVVPNRFFQDWLRSNFRKDLELACQQILGETLAIEFRVDESLAAPSPSTEQTGAAALQNGNGGRHSSATSTESALGDGSGIREEAAPTVEARTRRRFATLSTFVVGDSNRIAHQSALLAAKQPGSHTPLFVYGASGVGKTHLLEGVWSGLKRSHRHGPVVYLSAEQFTMYFQEALHGSGMPSFRRKYRGVETLLIDDIQFFVGKRATIGELLHTVDTLLRDGRQLVLAADRAPIALKALGPELNARISSGLVCKIDLPEYDTRLGIARHLAEHMQLTVCNEVLSYLASHFTSHAREISGALKRLHATSLALGRPISLRMAEEALADLIHHNGRLVRLGDIEKAVCEVFGIETESLQSSRKGKGVAHPRMLAMWLARKHTRAALSEIGRYFGRRTHSTVISAQKKIDAWMVNGRSLDLPERAWQVDDAIRRIEETLRAG
jgi:chromosomal replication initiator protein